MKPRPELAADLARLAAELSSSTVETVCAALESSANLPAAMGYLQALVAPWVLHRVDGLRDVDVLPAELALALRSAAAAVRTLREESWVELTWSGPETGLAEMRRTDQVLRDLILAARVSLDLVTFAAYRLEHVQEALRVAVGRGVVLRCFLESADESAGQLSISARHAFNEALSGRAEFYVWPLEKRPRNALGAPAKLHAKCAVADRRLAMISSANLTEDAMERNMETGVFIRGGGIPATLAAHFDRLIELGLFVRE